MNKNKSPRRFKHIGMNIAWVVIVYLAFWELNLLTTSFLPGGWASGVTSRETFLFWLRLVSTPFIASMIIAVYGIKLVQETRAPFWGKPLAIGPLLTLGIFAFVQFMLLFFLYDDVILNPFVRNFAGAFRLFYQYSVYGAIGVPILYLIAFVRNAMQPSIIQRDTSRLEAEIIEQESLEENSLLSNQNQR